jgi:non-heme chloroperoxidase
VRGQLFALALALAVLPAMAAEPASRWFTTSDRVRLHVLEAGDAARPGPVFAFIPGWSMPASLFRPQLEALGDRYLAAALDPRGQGESEVPAGGYATVRRAQDIAEFVARYKGRRVILVGWSLGALESLEYVQAGGAGIVHTLVLVDSSVGEEPPPGGGGTLVADLKQDRAAALENFVRAIFKTPRPDSEVRAIRDQAMRMPLGASLALFPGKVPRERWRGIARAFPGKLVYVVTPQFAEQAGNLKKARPATRIEVFNEAGHALFADEPERFNEIMASLASE